MAPFNGGDDLPKIREKLNDEAASALQWLLPNGRLIRNEFRVGDIDGTKGDSLSFNVRKLIGKDFKVGAKGFSSVLDVFVGHAGNFPDGLDLAREFLRIPKPERPQPQKGTAKSRAGAFDTWEQIIPPPADAGRPDFARLWSRANFKTAWAYRDADGRLLFYVARYEQEVTGKDGKAKLKKLTPVVSYGYGEDGRRHWRAKGNGHDILFGLDQLAARPHALVLIVEGEKAAEITRQIFPDWVVLAWKGGASNARNIDVSPLASRTVVLWPDADDAGTGAMQKIAKAAIRVGADVRMVALPPGLPDGWDVADDLPDGWTRATLESLLVNAGEYGRRNHLPAYHPAPSEPRDAALARQRRTIGDWFGTGTKLINARRQAAERAAAIIEAAGLNDDALNSGLTDRQIAARKAAISRKVNKQVAAEHGLERLGGNGPRLLLTGSQGSGKSRAAAEEIADLDGDMVVWWTVPTIDKAEEQADEYRNKYAQTNSLPALVVRGRGQDDPQQPGKAMCPRHKVVNRAASRGVEVRKKICAVCPLHERCGYLRQEAGIAEMGGGLFLMAREYAFMPSPAPTPDLFIGDESLIPVAVAEPITFNAERIRETGNWKRAGLGAVLDVGPILNAVYRAAIDQPGRILAALREAEISRKQIAEAIAYLDKVTETAAADAITGRMTDNEIGAALDQIDHDDIPNVIRMLRQIRREWDTGRAGLNTVTVLDGTVKVFGLRTPRIGKETPVLLLDGTGSATLNRALFGDLTHEHIPVERRAHVTGTTGKSYSRQSITGCDRHGEPIPSRAAEAERLRQEIADVARRQDGPVFVCATMKGEAALAPVLPGVAQCGHFAKLRGINAWEECETAVIVGREQVSPQRIEDMARPFTVADPEPFQAFGGYVRQTRGRRMRSGEVRPVEVEIHPDPRCQELLEQIREAEIVQAADRVRPIFNERSIVLLNELALDVTYDRIGTHKELVMGGNRFEQAAARGAAVPLSASELARCFPDLWPSTGAVTGDFQRVDKSHVSQIRILFGKRDSYRRARYRRENQKRPSPAAIRADAPNPRAALESVVGPVVWFEIEQKAEPAAAAQAETPAEPINGDISQIDAKPVEVLDQQLRIAASAGRLANLSARLDYARPPPRWGDLSDVPRERVWRARMSALHEMPLAAGGFR
jgi:hypothetical protein